MILWQIMSPTFISLSSLFDECLWPEVVGLSVATGLLILGEILVCLLEDLYPSRCCIGKGEESKTTTTSDGCQIFRVFKNFQKVETSPVDLDEKFEKI